MRVLIATDAWRPQVNGIALTLAALARNAPDVGLEVEFLTPEGFSSFPVPTYPSLRLSLPRRGEVSRRIEAAQPQAIHVATEGTLGLAARAYCLRRKLPFTTSYTTRYPQYIAARSPIPESWTYAALRRFHSASALTMVATPSLWNDLTARGFRNLGFWTRGVDTALFSPENRAELNLPRPIFLCAGRVAVEKNLEAFLSLDLPGSKVVIGEGPQEAELKHRFPKAHFLGLKMGADLAAHIAAADVFVFPSRTETFGVVQLEALACGVPVAAFRVMGPKDVIGDHPVGVLDDDLRRACLRALSISRSACRNFAQGYSWQNSARQFASHLKPIHVFH
jgi:glycosyltransferase involved in cell wall biosynthesis